MIRDYYATIVEHVGSLPSIRIYNLSEFDYLCMHSSSILSYDNKLALSDIVLILYNIPDIIADSVRPVCMLASIAVVLVVCF